MTAPVPTIVERQLELLEERGVNLSDRASKKAASAIKKKNPDVLRGVHSEFTTALLAGSRPQIGYENVTVEPRLPTSNDIDLLVEGDRQYCLQVKALSFILAKRFGKQVFDEVEEVSKAAIAKSSNNVAYRGQFSDQPKVSWWEISTESAEVGYLTFDLSYYGRRVLAEHLHRRLKKASNSLRRRDIKNHRNLAVLDVRRFWAAGDETYRDIVRSLLEKYENLSNIDGVLLLSYEPDVENHTTKSRFVPVRNPNSEHDIDLSIFADSPLQLYRIRFFSLPIQRQFEEGWNTLFRLNEGVLEVEGTPIMRII